MQDSERPPTLTLREARRLVDLTWQHVTESMQVPSTEVANALIEAAMNHRTPVSAPGVDESWREGRPRSVICGEVCRSPGWCHRHGCDRESRA